MLEVVASTIRKGRKVKTDRKGRSKAILFAIITLSSSKIQKNVQKN